MSLGGVLLKNCSKKLREIYRDICAEVSVLMILLTGAILILRNFSEHPFYKKKSERLMLNYF